MNSFTDAEMIILLVTDNRQYSDALAERLPAGLPESKLTVVASLSEARKYLEVNRPDLIITDVFLPDGSGLELLQVSGSDLPWPVLVASIHADELLALEAIKAGAVDFVVKSASMFENLPHIIRRSFLYWEHIKERRWAEKALIKSQRTIRQILDMVPHHIHAKDAEGRFIMANKAVSESYHMTPEEFVGQAHTAVAMDEEEVRRMLEDDREVMRTGKPKHIPEETCIDADGKLHWLETTKVPFDNDGQPAVLIVAIDITERKAAEEALRESESRYRELFNHAPAGIYEIDFLENRFVNVNDVACHYLGYSKEEILSLNPFDILSEESKRHFAERLMCFQAGTPVPDMTEFEVVARSGQVYWVLLTINFLKKNGRISGATVVAHDISERKRAEELVRLQRDLSAGLSAARTLDEANTLCLESVLHVSGVDCAGLYLVNEDGGLDLASQKELPGKFLTEASHYDADSPNCRLVMKGQPLYLDYADLLKMLNPDKLAVNSEGFRAAAAIPLLHEGRVVGCLNAASFTVEEIAPSDRLTLEAIAAQVGVAIMRLQTEERLRRTEEQFRQAQKMEAVGHLAGGVAHDFNNLLSAIMGYTELSLMDLNSQSTVYGNLQQVLTAGERARDLVRQLLAFSRKQLLEMKVLNLNDVISNLHKMLRRLISEHIILRTHLEPDLWNVCADPTQIEQILMNFAINSRDAMPNGGELSVETSNLVVGESQAASLTGGRTGHFVQLSVRDTGTGMDGETLNRIFEPFFTTKEKGKGTGLGLSTVYGIVKQHDGFVWPESEPGGGTLFRVILPRERSEIKDEAEFILNCGDCSGRETLLVVEDEELVRTLARDILQGLGYEVLTAGNGQEALRLMMNHRGRIDLLLTDVIMPGMNGREVYECLCGVRPELKVVFVSGYDDDIIGRHGVLDPGIKLLTKPFTVGGLTRIVRETLDS